MRKEEPEFPDEAKERAAEAAARLKAIAIEIKKEKRVDFCELKLLFLCLWERVWSCEVVTPLFL